MSFNQVHGVCIKRLDELLELLEVGGYRICRAWIDCDQVRSRRHYWNDNRAMVYAEVPSNAVSNHGETAAVAKVQVHVPEAADRPQSLLEEVASKRLTVGFAFDVPDAHAGNRRVDAAGRRRKRLQGSRNPGN